MSGIDHPDREQHPPITGTSPSREPGNRRWPIPEEEKGRGDDADEGHLQRPEADPDTIKRETSRRSIPRE